MSEILDTLGLQLSPLVGQGWLWLLIAAAAALLALAVLRGARDFFLRGLFLLLLAGLLANPMSRSDQRKSLPDKVLIVVDDSNSEKIGGRDKTAEAALARVQEDVRRLGPDVEPVVMRVAQHSDPRRGETTELFSALRDSLMTLPVAQVAGTVMITDGQVHDAPENAAALGPLTRLGPLHVVLTGRRDERDRRITVVSAPKYGLLNEQVQIEVRIDDLGGDAAPAPLEIWQDGERKAIRPAVTGTVETVPLTLSHPGQNVIEFRTPPVEGELTTANNTAPVIVNAVRDRMKVLLVSGTPHMGERSWRNLLKSDPGIDLVHFTILRPPTSMDPTPMNELSLIVFPVDELFNTKINDFDLIIFDKYRQYSLMPPQYFDNIRNYVRRGGALLIATGSDAVDTDIFQSALADTLPVGLGGNAILTGAYRPTLTDMGRHHPVTADLPGADRWGQWLTQLDVQQLRGRTLMTGLQNKPLMVIDQVDQGRVGVIASDNLWFWAKGGKTAGPYSEMLRNLSHWLMKEPELDENYLKAEARGRVITVSTRDAGQGPKGVVMTGPDGKTQDVTLSTPDGNWLTAQVSAGENGIYSFADGTRKAFVVIGTAQSAEYAAVETTPDHLKVAAEATGGGIVWFNDTPDLRLKMLDHDARRLSGDGWLGLRHAGAYTVTAVKSQQLLGNPLFLLLALAGLVGAWLWESGRRPR